MTVTAQHEPSLRRSLAREPLRSCATGFRPTSHPRRRGFDLVGHVRPALRTDPGRLPELIEPTVTGLDVSPAIGRVCSVDKSASPDRAHDFVDKMLHGAVGRVGLSEPMHLDTPQLYSGNHLV